MSEKPIMIKPSDLEDLRIVLESILGRDPLITEFTEILEVIATFEKISDD